MARTKYRKTGKATREGSAVRFGAGPRLRAAWDYRADGDSHLPTTPSQPDRRTQFWTMRLELKVV